MQITRGNFAGRLVSAAQEKRNITGKPGGDPFDKWHLCEQLGFVRQDFELSDRTIMVLKALISFWPERALPCDGAPAIVFPANKTLAARLNGMPESTLRRHLAHLTRAGVVSRHDSPNNKRFARRIGKNVELAFGFDLAPLARLAPELTRLGSEQIAHQQRCQILRDEILYLRAELDDMIDPALAQNITRLLRRRPVEIILQEMRDALHNMLPVENAADNLAETTDLSVSSDQNERHIQNSDESYFDSETCQATNAQNLPGPVQTERPQAEKQEGVTFRQVTHACQEYECFSGGRANNWQEFVQISDRLAPMIGIEQPVLHQAKQTMGIQAASVAVMCILERMNDIRSPGAYLRSLTQRAQANMFSLKPMVMALLQQKDQENCQLTI